jgi:predicted transposase YbfD/YdcC
VIRVERVRRTNGAESVEVAYFITSLGRDRADAARLLELVRLHWHVENRLRYVRDVTPGEDACRVRTGSSPEVPAALRNVALHLLEGVPARSKAAATRRMAARPEEAIQLLFT